MIILKNRALMFISILSPLGHRIYLSGHKRVSFLEHLDSSVFLKNLCISYTGEEDPMEVFSLPDHRQSEIF